MDSRHNSQTVQLPVPRQNASFGPTSRILPLSARTRRLASCEVTLLGLGTAHLASLGSGVTKRDAENLVGTAADLGINLIDTADTYGSTQCETMLGQILPREGNFLISTKAGLPYAEMPFPLSWLNQFGKKILQKMASETNFSSGYIGKCIDGSLRRLRRETLDFYFLHNPRGPVWENESLMNALVAAKTAGKIRHIGVSSDSAAVLRAAATVPLFEVFQCPLTAELPAERPPCGMVNRVLAGDSKSAARQLAARRVADELDTTPQAVMLAYAAAQATTATVLTGTRNPAHLRANAAALDLVLSFHQLARIEDAVDDSF